MKKGKGTAILGVIIITIVFVILSVSKSTVVSAIPQNISIPEYHSPKSMEDESPLLNSFQDSFEGSLQPFWELERPSFEYSGSFSRNYVHSGQYSYRVELRKTDPLVSSSIRSEITLPQEKPLEEHSYAFSVLLPAADEYYEDDPKSSEILCQWHNTPDAGESWTSAPLALLTVNGHWQINRLWDDASYTSNEQMRRKKNMATYDLGSYADDLGKWVTWEFLIKWGWETAQDPILQIYKNGELLLDLTGLPNTTNDRTGIYMKLGIYKWDWAENKQSVISKRIVYFDDVITRQMR